MMVLTWQYKNPGTCDCSAGIFIFQKRMNASPIVQSYADQPSGAVGAKKLTDL